MKNDALAVGKALAFEKMNVFVGDGLAEFVQQSGLAETGLRDDREGLATPRLDALKAVEHQFEFAAPADKGRQPALGADVEARTARTGGDHPVCLHRAGHALDAARRQGLEAEETLGERIGGSGDDGGTRLGQAFHP